MCGSALRAILDDLQKPGTDALEQRSVAVDSLAAGVRSRWTARRCSVPVPGLLTIWLARHDFIRAGNCVIRALWDEPSNADSPSNLDCAEYGLTNFERAIITWKRFTEMRPDALEIGYPVTSQQHRHCSGPLP